jgi:hypothetical protein
MPMMAAVFIQMEINAARPSVRSASRETRHPAWRDRLVEGRRSPPR